MIIYTQEETNTSVKDVKDFYKKHVQGTFIERPDIGKIYFSRAGLDETQHYTKVEYFPILLKIKEIIQTGKLRRPLEYNRYSKDNEYAVKKFKTRKDNAAYFYYISSEIQFAEELLRVTVAIKCTEKEGIWYYTFNYQDNYEMFLEERCQTLGPVVSELTMEGSCLTSKYIINEKSKNVNPYVNKNKEHIKVGDTFMLGDCIKIEVLKVQEETQHTINIKELNEKLEKYLNEDIAYHGTNVDFKQFNKDYLKDNIFEKRYGYGFYFTYSKSYAMAYGENILKCQIPDEEYILDDENSFNYQSNYIQKCLKNIIEDLWNNNKNGYTKLKEIYSPTINGRWIYNTLHDILGSAKQTSEYLYKHGIKGIYSYTGNCIVIFNEKDIKILNNKNGNYNLSRCPFPVINSSTIVSNNIITKN